MAIAQFSVRLRKDFHNLFGAEAQYTAVPEWWSNAAVGGPDMAEIRLEGHHEALAEALKMLNWEVEIYGALGQPVWWGYVNTVDVNFGGTTISLSLDDVYNAVAVAYVESAADGSISRQTTSFATDAQSIFRYGRREILLSATEGGASAATALRNRFLAQTKSPVPSTRQAFGNAESATLHCRGYWYRLARRYYVNERGLAEFARSGAGVQGIGNYYAATTISFEEPNLIKDSANGLGGLAEGDRFFLEGSTASDEDGNDNNRAFTVSEVISSGEIAVQGTVIEDSAGPLIRISFNSEGALTVAQQFRFPAGITSWQARRVAVQLRKQGTPSDNVLVDIRSDDNGTPVWPPLATATISGPGLSETMTWVEAPLDNAPTLVANTPYWICVRRSSTGFISHYVVNVNESMAYPDGDMLLTRGTGWFAREPDAHLPFRVLGREKTTAQMTQVVAQSELLGTDLEVDSGIETHQHRDGDRLLMDELNDLLGMGTDGGARIVAAVQANKWLRIRVQPAEIKASNLILAADGHLRSVAGQPLEPGQLIAGRWVELEFLPALDAVAGNVLFAERSRYEASSGLLSFETEGAESAWTLGVLPG